MINSRRAVTLSFACLSVLAVCGCASKSPGSDPRAELVKALTAQSNARSYRAKRVMSSPGGVDTSYELEFSAPDHYHMLTDSNLVSGAGATQKQEVFILGIETYHREASGRWRKDVNDASVLLSQFRDPKLAQKVMDNAADVKFIGGETLDGVPVLVYQHKLSVKADRAVVNNVGKTWVGQSDGLPHKMEVESKQIYQGQSLTVKSVTTYYDYNADIKIEPPVKF